MCVTVPATKPRPGRAGGLAELPAGGPQPGLQPRHISHLQAVTGGGRAGSQQEEGLGSPDWAGSGGQSEERGESQAGVTGTQTSTMETTRILESRERLL